MPKKLLRLLCAALLLLSTLNVPGLAADTVNPELKSLQHNGESKKDASLADAKRPDDRKLQKLDSALLPLADTAFLPKGVSKDQYTDQVQAQGNIQKNVNSAGKDIDAAGIYVYITIKKESDWKLIQPYVNRVANHKDTLAVAWVDADRLTALAALDCVVNISQVTPPVVNKVDTSEGVSLHKANLAQALTKGAGVKVGVISDGANHWLDAVATGDLPGNVTVLSDVVSGDEGTAMLEIVYDMAPGAQLFFHDCGKDTLAYIDAVDALVAAGCTIIVDDISWITEPFFEDGVVAEHYKQVMATNQVLFISSAGNSADRHFQGVFYNSSSYNNWNDFSSGANNGYEDLYVKVAPGSSLRIVLQWKEPFDANGLSDYDLYLLDTASDNYFSSTNDNATTLQPVERIGITNPTGSTYFFAISVKRINAPTPAELEVYIYGGSVYPDNIVPSDSIFGHTAVPGVVTCGAINPATPTAIEEFSSQGPVTTLTATRKKPDICGADGVNVTGAGGFSDPFYGTSAAAPHVAAIAALVKARFPKYTPTQIAALLRSKSTDLGNPGYDSIFGNGLANALAAVTSSNYVRFDSQKGSTVNSQLVLYGGKAIKPADPKYAGYQFGGWYKEAACTNPWNFATGTVKADTKLFAKWTAIKYTVAFNSQGGSTVASKTTTYNKLITAPAAPTRTGYAFGGWFKQAACTTVWNFATDKVTANTTLFAKWTANKYAITATSNNSAWGTVTGGGSIAYGTAAKLTATPKAGYRFVRWLEGSTAVSTSASYTFTVSKARTLKAEFAKIGTPVVKAVSAGYNGIKLTWAAVAGAQGYEISRYDPTTKLYKVITTVTTTNYTNTGLTTNTTYSYKVRAKCVAGSTVTFGGYSAVVSAKPLPAAPIGVKAARVSSSSIKVSWSAVAGANGYEVCRATTSGGTYKPIKSVTGLNLTNTGLVRGRTYYYKVRAYRVVAGKKVYSLYSAVVSAKP